MSSKPIGTSLNSVQFLPVGTVRGKSLDKIHRLTKLRIPSQLTKRLETIQNSRAISRYRTLRKLSNFRRKTATRKIGTFMKKHRSKIRLRFLNTICSDSNECIAFGKETNVIREFFNDFDFNLLNENPVLAGSSNNGTVHLLTFKKDGYVANAIFKTSNRKTADNLAYEAIVGRFINKQKLRFPCFLETYGLYYNVNNRKRITQYQKMDINRQGLIKSCESPLSIGIMIENIKNSHTLHSTIKNYSTNYPKEYVEFMNKELLYILYQIYAPLSILSDVFTHYDLHANNIMLYTLEDYKYIEYNYHYDDRTVTFNSIYIVKIIDYGRCFFKEETGYNPEDIYKDLCRSKYRTNNCRECGKDSGFTWLDPNPFHYISSQKRNMSHDLRLLHILQTYAPSYSMDILQLIFSVRYLQNYGTPEITGQHDDWICNVNDASQRIERLIEKDFFKQNNDYDPINKLGEMHIYSDGRPMEYIAV
jgi:hypothetical protein